MPYLAWQDHSSVGPFAHSPTVGQLPSWPHFRRKTLFIDRRNEFIDTYLARIECDFEQILIPFIFYRRHAFKPYQGLFNPIGSVLSHQVESFPHSLYIKCHGLRPDRAPNVARV